MALPEQKAAASKEDLVCLPQISTYPDLRLLPLCESGKTSGFQHCWSREDMFHFHTAWMLMREEQTSKQESRLVFTERSLQGTGLIPFQKVTNKATKLISSPNICVFVIRDLQLPDVSWTNYFERLFSLEAEASPVLPSTEVLLHEPWVLPPVVSLKFGCWKKTR